MPTSQGATLRQLAEVIDARLVGDGSMGIVDVSHDSREIGPGGLFVAIRGLVSDGHDFVSMALEAGATAVCVEDRTNVPGSAPALITEDSRAALGHLAARVHGHPSEQMSVVGVTGTNGKTTVSYILRAILSYGANEPVGMIGTNGAFVGSEEIPNVRTTPESSDLQRILAGMNMRGARHVVMEVSSHALELQRVVATEFAVAAFTNLSQDHLDFHDDMESYFAAKARLFEHVPQAVISLSSPWGERLTEMISQPDTITTVGPGGMLQARQTELSLSGSTFFLEGEGIHEEVSIPLVGSFNVDNALVAIGCALALGVSVENVAQGLRHFNGIPGRFERVGAGDFAVFVDYAHTPDGIEAAVGAARQITVGQVIVLIGAGGDRDIAKRPMMGAAASLADEIWVTSDNPRTEEPQSIIDAVVSGIPSGARFDVEPDRAKAIRKAIAGASATDIVLILGKGHEQGQDIGGVVHPFDDRIQAAQALQENMR